MWGKAEAKKEKDTKNTKLRKTYELRKRVERPTLGSAVPCSAISVISVTGFAILKILNCITAK
jgi:hypothetical protein